MQQRPAPDLIAQIRKAMRTRRRQLDDNTLAANQTAIAKHFLSWLGHKRPRAIASYCPYAGEASPAAICQSAKLKRSQFHYPVIQGRSMSFHAAASRWRKNALGIMEPNGRAQPATPPKRFDMVLVPLLAFDSQGNRLGQGGGFYDRCFAFKQQQRVWQKPLLIGIAHQFQQVERLPSQPWDIPLDVIVTEAGVIVPRR